MATKLRFVRGNRKHPLFIVNANTSQLEEQRRGIWRVRELLTVNLIKRKRTAKYSKQYLTWSCVLRELKGKE